MLRRLLLILVCFGVTPVMAHAFLDHALPAVGSTVQGMSTTDVLAGDTVTFRLR
jgi:hypothetical protein